jgi:uncharacterized protein YkwD
MACNTPQPELIMAINKVRTVNNLTALNYQIRLNEFARYRFDKLQPPFLSHKNLRKDYVKFMSTQIKPPFLAACGEIILKNYAINKNFDYYDIKDYITQWLNSFTHKKVILNPEFENIGYYIGFKDEFTMIVIVEFDIIY